MQPTATDIKTRRLKRAAFQIFILVMLSSVCIGGYAGVLHVLNLPFRQVNDSLHREDAAVDLDILIPGGTYIDENMTIREVIKLRFARRLPAAERIAGHLVSLIPETLRHMFNAILFFFWSFVYMTFIRVFTFLRYSRALGASLALGGFTYFFMPDFSPGRLDDAVFMTAPLGVIGAPVFFVRWRRRKTNKAKASESLAFTNHETTRCALRKENPNEH
ncbi:MAG: hypothetical protein R6U50_08100 [Desulfobacterales bacterium]